MGSSIVTMCDRRLALMCPIIAAMVVVLPVPAGPVTRTSPRRPSASERTAPGSRSSSKDGPSARTRRIASDTSPRWRKQFTRNRPTPGIENPASASNDSANSDALRRGRSSVARVSVSEAESAG